MEIAKFNAEQVKKVEESLKQRFEYSDILELVDRLFRIVEEANPKSIVVINKTSEDVSSDQIDLISMGDGWSLNAMYLVEDGQITKYQTDVSFLP